MHARNLLPVTMQSHATLCGKQGQPKATSCRALAADAYIFCLSLNGNLEACAASSAQQAPACFKMLDQPVTEVAFISHVCVLCRTTSMPCR